MRYRDLMAKVEDVKTEIENTQLAQASKEHKLLQ